MDLSHIRINNHVLVSIIGGVVIFAITFPNIDGSYYPGLDPSYQWAFNHLLLNDYQRLSTLIYPYGPLGFLKMPVAVGANLSIYIIVVAFLKMWAIVALMEMAAHQSIWKYIFSMLAVLTIASLPGINYLIYAIVSAHSLKYLRNSRYGHIAVAAFIAVLSLYIKVSIGLTAISIAGMALILNWTIYRDTHRLLISFASILAVSALASYCVFGGIDLAYTYFINALKLSGDFSSILAYHAINNWWLIAIVFISVIASLFVVRSNLERCTVVLMLPAIFAMWKHSVSRQDLNHAPILLYFLLFFWCIQIILLDKQRLLPIIALALASCLAYHINLNNIEGYKGIHPTFAGIQHLKTSVLHFSSTKEKFILDSQKAISELQLDANLRSTIGNKSIDIYPWELIYVPANNFNWQTRTNLSGFFSHEFDDIMSKDFSRSSGPENILFHMIADEYSINFNSLDGRYLLNENPITLLAILNNYDLIEKSDNLLLFEKNELDNFTNRHLDNLMTVTWDSWITIPKPENAVLRIKIFQNLNWNGQLKNFFYRSGSYSYDLLLNNGQEISYSYQPSNARDGIWLEPFVQFPNSRYSEATPVKIRFHCEDDRHNDPQISYQFEHINISDKLDNAVALFGKSTSQPPILLTARKDASQISGNRDGIILEFATLDAQGYSTGFSFDLDSLWSEVDQSTQYIIVESQIEYYSADGSGALVITSNGGRKDFWTSTTLAAHSKNATAYGKKMIDRNNNRKGMLSVYVWNPSDEPISLKNFQIKISVAD